jgi:hypothetical protein
MTAADLSDDAFLQAFESASLPNEAFHHRDHVRAARLFLLREASPLGAVARFGSSLRRFAAAHGAPGLYHETITLAYLFLIHERMARRDPHESWERFQEANPDLFAFKPGILDAYYRKETLSSDLARRVFVLPDRLAEAAR